MTRKITISVLVVCLGTIAWPVYGFFQVHGLFNATDKYREWFQETAWPGEAPGALLVSPVARFPYPDKEFVMTERLWRQSSRAVEFGRPDWYDSEVVRQRAEVEEYAPAMDLLAWMYEHGRGLGQDYRKAFTWYERAKLAGKTELRGNSTRIFDRLSPPAQFFAEIQLAEDIRRMKPEAEVEIIRFERVNLHVFKQQRELNTLR
ncbi:MAG: hypothetical protein ACE5GT_06755 [Rhodospirillales bacterium]